MTTLSCAVCMQPAALRCSRCKAVSYCSQDHQKLLWAVHATQCGQNTNYLRQPDLKQIETDIDTIFGFDVMTRKPLAAEFKTFPDGPKKYFDQWSEKVAKMTPTARQEYLVTRRDKVLQELGALPPYIEIRQDPVISVFHSVAQLQDTLLQMKVPDLTSSEFVHAYFNYMTLMRNDSIGLNFTKPLSESMGWDQRYREGLVANMKRISDKLEVGGEKKIAIFRFAWIILDSAIKEDRINEAIVRGEKKSSEREKLFNEIARVRNKAGRDLEKCLMSKR